MSIQNDNVHLDSESRTFGLIYEEKPEEFYLEGSEREPRIGDTILLGDGRKGNVEDIGGGYLSLKLEGGGSASLEDPVRIPKDAGYKIKRPSTTYPVLDLVDSVSRAKFKPPQILIQGENLHALKLLTFAYAGKIDCIYIDPPYNTGSTDWRYNNDYVNKNDAYRHSKWLSFMEHRLKVAKQLLNPENSVLICAIDEYEVHRLGLLLEQIFSEARIQMVSLAYGAPVAAKTLFSSYDEYLYYVMIGSAIPQKVPEKYFSLTAIANQKDELIKNINAAIKQCKGESSELVKAVKKAIKKSQTEDTQGSEDEPYRSLLRAGSNSSRDSEKNAFYPIFIKEGKIIGLGDPLLDPNLHPDNANIKIPDGAEAIWPIGEDGLEKTWEYIKPQLAKLLERHFVKVGPKGGIYYISEKGQQDLENGVYGDPTTMEFSPQDGHLVVPPRTRPDVQPPSTMWYSNLHFTNNNGQGLLKSLIGTAPEQKFETVKSLYAVEDAIRFFVADKPNALVLDFFAGSGTTGHAVMRLNKQDDGERVCISVTNNENGICDEVTFPRLKACINGRTPAGELISGKYKGRDPFPVAEGFKENLEYFKICYANKEDVELGRELPRILPLLWMTSGSKELLTDEEIEKCRKEPYMLFDSFGLLTDYRFASKFADCISSGMKLLAVSTFDDERYQWLASRFSGVCYQLPEAYLHSMEMNGGI